MSYLGAFLRLDGGLNRWQAIVGVQIQYDYFCFADHVYRFESPTVPATVLFSLVLT